VDLPERVDVVVADQIGHFGFEAGLIEYFVDARRRFLKPGGTMIPLRVDLQIAPVDAPGCAEWLQFWSRRPAGLDFEPACAWAENTGYPVSFAADELLGSEACGCAIDLMTITTNPLSVAADLTIERSGTLHGIGGWFRAWLAEGHTMTNSPLAAERISRRNVFLPIARPVDVSTGDRVSVTMDVRPAESLVTWRVAVYGAGRSDAEKAAFHHSTLRGMLMRREDLRRTHPAFVPVLTERGRARRTILELCDGRRPLAEIEQEVYTRHPTLFRSSGEAAAFVAEVVTGYTQ
jgi:hypothetical protein